MRKVRFLGQIFIVFFISTNLLAEEVPLPECKLLSLKNHAVSTTREFVQKRYITGMTKPIVSSGEMIVDFHGKNTERSLKWKTIHPYPSSVTVSAKGFLLESESVGELKEEYQSSHFQKIAKVILNMLSLNYSGPKQLEELKQQFNLFCFKNQTGFSLQGKPKKRSLSRLLKSIEISGKNYATLVKVEDRRGDRSEIVLK